MTVSLAKQWLSVEFRCDLHSFPPEVLWVCGGACLDRRQARVELHTPSLFSGDLHVKCVSQGRIWVRDGIYSTLTPGDNANSIDMSKAQHSIASDHGNPLTR